jgi:hypothetical protein
VADVAAREGGAEPEQPTVERAVIGS